LNRDHAFAKYLATLQPIQPEKGYGTQTSARLPSLAALAHVLGTQKRCFVPSVATNYNAVSLESVVLMVTSVAAGSEIRCAFAVCVAFAILKIWQTYRVVPDFVGELRPKPPPPRVMLVVPRVVVVVGVALATGRALAAGRAVGVVAMTAPDDRLRLTL
jgi:hypothetical protein